MAFDKQNRNLLQRMVDSCRRLLTEEFTKQLQELYGIQPGTGNIIDLSEMVHLTDDQYAIASLLRDRIEHLASGLSISSASPAIEKSVSALPPFVKGGQGGFAAIERLIREQAFTVLNRFAALRMCEEREIVKECVRKGMQSQGFYVYLQVAGTSLGDTYQRYKVFLYCLFDELAIDLGILFDRYSPFGLLFPREQALTELLNVINDPQLKDLWKEDETIGWVYQYFNTKEEREAMRKASQAPRNSRELAVRNQFFTPRYVVEFLTDNTLGRIWYEMTRGNTILKDKCNYLVRRLNEVFLAEGEESPLPSAKEIPSSPTVEGAKFFPPPLTGGGQGEGEQRSTSNEDLLKQPVYIPHRPIKDPRRIAMLDPACGSMHFGLYAFELYEAIYEEAWDNYPELLTDIREQVADKEDFMKMVPERIIRHNINGIDIDPRACQIAGLSLWLRAQKSYQRLRLKPADRPMITKSNIVCAEPMPGEKEMLEEFIVKLRPPVLGGLVREVWNKMQLAGEAGSLLKIEEELKTAIEEAKEEWERLKSGDSIYQEVLFKELQKPVQQQMRFDVTGVRKKEFWDEAETLVLSALRDFAESATNEHGYQRKLFAEDAVQGFAFIDLCRKRFDVVLMNPPFGEVSLPATIYISEHYNSWNNNVLCAFLNHAWDVSYPLGMVGAIYDRTAIVKSTYEDFRRGYLIPNNRLTVLADLGWGVLDANVEVTTSILSHLQTDNLGIFVDCKDKIISEKGTFLKEAIIESSNMFLAKSDSFNMLPNAVIGYDFPIFLRKAFLQGTSLEQNGFKAYQGHALKAEKHFRLWWEIPLPFSVGFHSRMFNGSGYSPYSTAFHDCVIVTNSFENLPKDSATVLRNKEVQQLPGICFGKRGEYYCAHILPKGHIFTVEGQSIPCDSLDLAAELLGMLNTPLVRLSLNKYCGQHKYSGYVNLLPYFRFNDFIGVRNRVKQVILVHMKARSYDETQSLFSLALSKGKIIEYASNMVNAINDSYTVNSDCEDFCHCQSISAYNVSEEEKKIIESFKINQPPFEPPIEDVDMDEQCHWFAAHSVISITTGVAKGRWDIRTALDEKLAPKLPDPFDPLPACPPAMLVGTDGLPATPGNIVSEEWLRARPDVNTLPPEGLVKQPTISDSEYPIKIAWDGILVDDDSNQYDIISRIREVLEVLWKDQADPIEQEACEILGVKSLRDYFRKPSGFFADHLKRYSKSRRQAPIYWPLSTASGSYTLWIYYHRLTDQMLYKCVNDFVNPKIEAVSRGIEKLRSDIIRGGNSKQKEELAVQMDFLQEVKGFRDEILRVAQLPYKSNLNDGVLITASPLHNLFNLPKWKKDLTECWKKLEAGEYDWAHLAYTIWPDRVREVCKRDRSIAIAHGLEDICEVKPPETKTKKRKSADKKSSEKTGRKKTGGDYALEKMGLDFE